MCNLESVQNWPARWGSNVEKSKDPFCSSVVEGTELASTWGWQFRRFQYVSSMWPALHGRATQMPDDLFQIN
jgi:hypothetical protein